MACALETSNPRTYKDHLREIQAFDNKSAKIAGSYVRTRVSPRPWLRD